MSVFLLALLDLGIKIAQAKLSGNAAEIAKIPALLVKMAANLNQLSVAEVGKPIDWSNIQEHEHL